MAKFNTKHFAVALMQLFLVNMLIFVTSLVVCKEICFCGFIASGFYYRNAEFGSLFKHELKVLSRCNTIDNLNQSDKFVERKESAFTKLNIIPDFSHAGSKTEVIKQNFFNVNEYGILSDVYTDCLSAVQLLIDNVGKIGGGEIYFPKGKYYFNISNKVNFLQINHSNITLTGETDKNGKPLAQLICCSNTLDGKKNPWLSPFFITTGEQLQRSNIFWGVQFKNKKNIITKSESLTDPGSDGEILMPKFATFVTANARKGDYELCLKDTNTLKGVKYILLALYNTSTDGNLIKEILGLSELNEMWKTALRAGAEQAPSFQHLLEIDEIIDEHRIRLTRPLLRNCQLLYTPEIFSVNMLENVRICNLHIKSKWNGLFRHHGFPKYYSIKQSQEMDYGWNGINLKRVTHSCIDNVVIDNFTNPLYVMDSRNITVSHLTIQGNDGHQGIKVYCHACDNLFENVVFKSHYADMLGGEGNAYGNVFKDIIYKNSYFKPADFDFHGFSEGPMSPPAYNLFENVRGFRYIKGAGAQYNQPACAQNNVWWNCIFDGQSKHSWVFLNLLMLKKSPCAMKFYLLRYVLAQIIKQKKYSVTFVKNIIAEKTINNSKLWQWENHHKLFKNSIISGIITKSNVPKTDDSIIIENINKLSFPKSLFNWQCQK